MRDRSKPSLFAPRPRDLAPRVDSTVRVRRLDPATLLAAPPPVRCVRCGGGIDDEPAVTTAGTFHAHCKPVPAPVTATVTALPLAERSGVSRRFYRDDGPRYTHLNEHDQRRVLGWLAEHGPATSRMAAWALGLPAREVQLHLRSLDGRAVESAGVVLTGRRGHPPMVWRVREQVAA